MVGGHGAYCYGTLAGHQLVNHQLLVDGLVKGGTDGGILEGVVALSQVELHVLIGVGTDRLGHQVVCGLNRPPVGQRHAAGAHHIDVAIDQTGGQAGRGNHADNESLEVGATQVVVLISGQLQLLTSRFADKLEGAGAHGICPEVGIVDGGVVPGIQNVLGQDVQEAAQSGENALLVHGAVQADPHGVLVNGLNLELIGVGADAVFIGAAHTDKLGAVIVVHLFVGDGLQGEHHVIGGKGLAVVPGGVLVQIEGHAHVVIGHLPAVGQAGQILTVVGAGDHPLKHLVSHAVAVVTGGVVDVQGVPGGDDCHGNHFILGAGGSFSLGGGSGAGGATAAGQYQAECQNSRQESAEFLFHQAYLFSKIFPCRAAKELGEITGQRMDVLGSSASRRPFPMKLMLKMVIIRARPGGSHIHWQLFKMVMDWAL